jgi:hypothetical protein
MWHSYRGSEKILELPGSLESGLDKVSISEFVKKSQQLT